MSIDECSLVFSPSLSDRYTIARDVLFTHLFVFVETLLFLVVLLLLFGGLSLLLHLLFSLGVTTSLHQINY
jgi:hypothetical protein